MKGAKNLPFVIPPYLCLALEDFGVGGNEVCRKVIRGLLLGYCKATRVPRLSDAFGPCVWCDAFQCTSAKDGVLSGLRAGLGGYIFERSKERS
jgi:hypothetical protein